MRWLALLFTLLPLAFSITCAFEREKPTLVSLSKSYEDFPNPVCMEGTRSYSLVVVPLAKEDVALVYYWAFLPQGKCGSVEVTATSSGGEAKVELQMGRSGIYCYTPLVLAVLPGGGEVKVRDCVVKVPDCWSGKKPWLDDGEVPSALLLNGRLDDLDWEVHGTRTLQVEISKVYDDAGLKVVALRITLFGKEVKYFKARVLSGGEVLEEFEIPAYRRGMYSETNAVFFTLPEEADKIVVDEVTVEV